MKRFILIKPVHHVQIGHVYEHLYCHQLAEIFRDNGLFEFVDYSIDGKTYYDGYVRIEINLYSAQALKLEKHVTDLSIDYSEDAINGAIIQILAEKQVDATEVDMVIIQQTLKDLDDLSWTPLQNVEIQNFKAAQKTKKGLQFTDVSSRNFLYLTQFITFNTATSKLSAHVSAPLFAVIANALRQNLQELIADTSYCYSVDDRFTRKGTLLKDINRYRVDKRQATQLSTEPEYTKALFTRINTEHFAEKLSEYLQTNKSGVPFGLPDDDEISKKVAILIGEKGWREIGTVQNINKVLEGISVSYALGASRSEVPFK